MELVHKGFDGLDVSFRATLPLALVEHLEDARSQAESNGGISHTAYNGVELAVASSGARGGYRYRCNTGPLGGTWFFKRPNARDPWGARVSSHSLPLATQGFEEVRQGHFDTMARLGILYVPNGESISRIDYAIDVLAPDFAPDPNRFIMHSRTGHATREEMEIRQSNGRSGRITSITIGKSSSANDQAILYDKRQEALDRGRVHWPMIWNANRTKQALPQLQITNPGNSRVWRIELRAMKKCLKKWGIVNSTHIPIRLVDCLTDLTQRIRYCESSNDSNRARWGNEAIWNFVQHQLQSGLSELRSGVTPTEILELNEAQRRRMLMRQGLGALIGAARIDHITHDGFEEWLEKATLELRSLSRMENVNLARKLQQ